jgi:hypothetical protein
VGPRAGLDVMEKKNILPLLGIEPRLLDRPPSSIVAIPTELSRLYLVRKLSVGQTYKLTYRHDNTRQSFLLK